MSDNPYRAYYAVVMEEQSTQYYEMGFLANPTIGEVLSDFHAEVRDRLGKNSELLLAAQNQVHTTGQENHRFNESIAFEFSPWVGSWLRIVCPSRMELNQLVSGD